SLPRYLWLAPHRDLLPELRPKPSKNGAQILSSLNFVGMSERRARSPPKSSCTHAVLNHNHKTTYKRRSVFSRSLNLKRGWSRLRSVLLLRRALRWVVPTWQETCLNEKPSETQHDARLARPA